MRSFALSAIGRDRPGIVAAIAKVLYETGCNVEDSSMTLLRGNFAVMLVLAAPDGTEAATIEDALAATAAELGLLCSVREVDDRAVTAHPTHTLSVYGADRPGILLAVASELAARGVNITNLSSRLVGPPDRPVYVLILDLAAPPGTDVDIHVDGVDLTVRAVEEDVL